MTVPSTMPTDVSIDIDTGFLVVGGGPVGMFTAYRLAQLGQQTTLIERNESTSVHPKMEYVSHRSMELYRRVGLLAPLKKKAVADHRNFSEVFATGLTPDSFHITTIDRPSRTEYQKRAFEINDGTFAREPYMRMMQSDYEVILKDLIQQSDLVRSYWGLSFDTLVEYDDAVLSKLIDCSGKQIVVKSRYVLGCDGAGSRVRLAAGLQSPRNSLPVNLVYIHFKCRDFDKMTVHGDFWHLMIMNGSVLVAQDGVETYTLHHIVPPGTTIEVKDSEAFLKKCLGGFAEALDIKIDEVILTGRWQSDLSVASSFRSDKGRVFLAGDAAHQITPVGAHGLNSGIQDAFDLTWKISATTDGWGGDILLDSYNRERRPVAELNISMIEKATMESVSHWFRKTAEIGPDRLISINEDGRQSRFDLAASVRIAGWIHDQVGTVMGYRYNGSPVIVSDPSVPEPRSSITEYIASTWPGARPPHVYLNDGSTSIFDLFGTGFTIVDFTTTGQGAKSFTEEATKLGIPLTKLHLPDEPHCHRIWERNVVLVRPDGFVAWRCPPHGLDGDYKETVREILLTATGKG